MNALWKMMIALLFVSGVAVAQNQHPDHVDSWLKHINAPQDINSIALDRAQLFRIREKGKGNIREIITELDFVLKHNDMDNVKYPDLYWIEITRTVVFKSEAVVNEEESLLDLGVSALHINEENIKIDAKTSYITMHQSGRSLSQIMRISISRELFDDLGNRQGYSYQLTAKNFPSQSVTLKNKDALRFTNRIQEIKHNRELRENNR